MTDQVTIRVELGSPAYLLTLLFIGLKLGHVITWSWLWVVSPLWLSVAAGLAVWFAVLAIAGITDWYDYIRIRARRRHWHPTSPRKDHTS
jgi:hypothetical protein